MVLVWNDYEPPEQESAPWKASFLEDIMTLEGQEFSFSTLHSSTISSDAFANELMFEPRARFCAFRCFWAELPSNSDNPAPRNKRTFMSDMPTFTTDVRTSKIRDIVPDCSAGLLPGSGGGEPCEAVWWAPSSRTQWRIRGWAFVVGPDIESNSFEAFIVRQTLRSRMQVFDAEHEESWSWERELTAHFGNLTPAMRGRFVAPPPGQSVDLPYDHEHLKVGQEIYDLDHMVARRHFRVVVIVPDEVEVVEMKNPKTARRHFYTFDEGRSSWSHRECWP